eukprot:6199112-Pleurochrysis_carterae.AAC.2
MHQSVVSSFINQSLRISRDPQGSRTTPAVATASTAGGPACTRAGVAAIHAAAFRAAPPQSQIWNRARLQLAGACLKSEEGGLSSGLDNS